LKRGIIRKQTDERGGPKGIQGTDPRRAKQVTQTKIEATTAKRPLNKRSGGIESARIGRGKGQGFEGGPGVDP